MKASSLKSYIKEQILSTLSSPVDEASAEEVENQKDLNKELEKTAQLQSQISEDEDEDDDKKAVASAKASKGKFKKLDVATKALKDITTEMKSLARKYSAADNESEKEKIKDTLKSKTSKKKELESLVNKLEKDVV
tara:strand:+ start:1278 stop:1685 length:408 start_codon:yes stop_codon:yes gene_type:complete